MKLSDSSFILIAFSLFICFECNFKTDRSVQNVNESTINKDSHYTSIEVSPAPNANFEHASFTIYMPESEEIRYIMVAVWGFSQDGRFLAREDWLQSFVQKTKGALIGCYFRSEPAYRREIHYAAAAYGSGPALDMAIEEFDTLFPDHDLKNLPLFIWGQSAGGQYAYGYSCYRPERLIGFFASKGGIYFKDPLPGTYKVPALIISGERDEDWRKENIRYLFEIHRENGAPWCWMEEKEQGHMVGKSKELILPYCAELLARRLDPESHKLFNLNVDNCVTVDLNTQQVLPSDHAQEIQIIYTGVLPSRKVYEIWKSLDNGEKKYIE